MRQERISVENKIKQSIDVKSKILESEDLIKAINDAGLMMKKTLSSGGKVLLCGNGGSSTDAMHIAGEITGRFQKDRRSLPGIALSSNLASITAIANDYGYEDVFARETEGLMNPGDLLIGISTSGNSENVYRALLKAKEIGGKTVALLGKTGGKTNDAADITIIVPSDVTARIQEAHIMIGHIMCEIAEADY